MRFVLLFATAIFATSCDRKDTQPPGFPVDPFKDAATYQGVLDKVDPGKWEVKTFHRKRKSQESPNKHRGIALAISKHRDKNEVLFLYRFLKGSGPSMYSLKGPEGSPQSDHIDAFNPTRIEWKTREKAPVLSYWEPHTAKIGYRYEIFWPLEETSVKGKFGNYSVDINFDHDAGEWRYNLQEIAP